MESTKKLSSLTIHQKAIMIEQIDKGRSTKEVAREFGVNQNTLRYIYKTKEKILTETFKSENSNRKRIKQTKCPELEELLIKWMEATRAQGEKITGSQIKSIALEEATKLGHDKFSASNGWLCSFFKRHSIVLSEFNKGSDSTIQLIKLKPEPSKVNEELFEYDPEEMEITDFVEEVAEEEEFVWKTWCRFCGQSEEISSFDASLADIFYRLFGSTFDEGINACQKCVDFLRRAKAFVERVTVVDSMMLELEELETKRELSDEMALKIRGEYGLEDEEGGADDEGEETEMTCEEINNEEAVEIDAENEEISYMEKLESIEEVTYDNQQDVDFVEYEEIVTSPQHSIESEYDFSCHFCDQTFDRMFHLANHTHKEHNCLPQVACITCGKFLATWDTILSHRRKHGKKNANVVCKICGWRSISKTGLTIHQKLMHDSKKEKNECLDGFFGCEICFKEFKDAALLRNHQRVHLPDDQKLIFACDYCDKRLGSKYSLKQHIEAIHVKKISPISCNLCGKTFNYPSNLRSHLISHTNEAVVCPVCKATFKNRVSYQSHKKLHQEDKKNVECPKCEKKFYNRTHLRQHLISHSMERNFVCRVVGCTSSYKYEKDLNNHMNNHHHNDLKVVQTCDICNKKFKNKDQLDRHIYKAHSAEIDGIEVDEIYVK